MADQTHKLQAKYLALLDQYGGSVFALNEALIEQAYQKGLLDELLQPLFDREINQPKREYYRLFRDMSFPSLRRET